MGLTLPVQLDADSTHPVDWRIAGDDCRLRPANAYATFSLYLGSPPLHVSTSGLYLHSPASEGMWMEALVRSTPGKVCTRLISAPDFPLLPPQNKKGE